MSGWLRVAGLGLAGGWLCVEVCAGAQKIYYMSKYLASREGYDFKHPSVAERATSVRAAGIAGGLACGVVSYAAFKYALDRILVSKTANKARLFDDLRHGNVAPRASLAEFWRSVGPYAPSGGPRRFVTLYGGRALSSGLSLLWACVLAPYAAARSEAAMVPKTEPKEWGQVRRAREESVRKEVEDIMAQRRGPAAGEDAIASKIAAVKPADA